MLNLELPAPSGLCDPNSHPLAVTVLRKGTDSKIFHRQYFLQRAPYSVQNIITFVKCDVDNTCVEHAEVTKCPLRLPKTGKTNHKWPTDT